MYQTLLVYHSLLRWLVLAALFYAVFLAGTGYFQRRPYTQTDHRVRHWTTAISHLQLLIGLLLYFRSPITAYFRNHFKATLGESELTFFGFLHPLLMLTAIVVLTIGSALAKRQQNDLSRFKTQLFWFSAALVLILLAIPWPFSPLAARPYYR
ncbi:MAG: hypothetical protein EOP52_06670 [Sphingobacteriales bacterium]|nr:MAG: hypothetical protein EOP52_06670 [Sphingobacteriales bacterium]